MARNNLETVASFPSKSSKTGKVYYVKLNLETSVLSCDCPAWVFKTHGERQCFHTQKVRLDNIIKPKIIPAQSEDGKSLSVSKEVKRRIRL